MRRSRFVIALTLFIVSLLTFAPVALGRADGGEGWFGESTDKDVTIVMFITIAFFPTVILIFSLIQRQLDRRKHARMDAARARAASVDWRGGW